MSLRRELVTKRSMDAYLLARVIAVVFALPSLLGVLWFADSLGPMLITAGLLVGLCGLTVAFSPRSKLPSGEPRRIVVALCLLGIGGGLVLIVSDISRPFEIEWHVVTIRLIQIAAPAAIAIEAFERSPKST